MNTPLKTAVAYLRCSGLGQVDGDSFPRQRDVIMRYANLNGFMIDSWFIDKGVSGTIDGVMRPEFSSLMLYAEEKKVAAIIVESSSRLARDLIVAERITMAVQRLGIQLIDASSDRDLCDPRYWNVFMRQVLGAADALVKNEIVCKLAAARQRIRDSGKKCEGRKAYGDWPGENETLNRIAELSIQCHSSRTITAYLTAEGSLSRGGTPWNHGTIARILQREDIPQRRAALVENVAHKYLRDTSSDPELLAKATVVPVRVESKFTRKSVIKGREESSPTRWNQTHPQAKINRVRTFMDNTSKFHPESLTKARSEVNIPDSIDPASIESLVKLLTAKGFTVMPPPQKKGK